MTNTKMDNYKFFTEINSVENLLVVLFNQIKKSNHSYVEVISAVQAIIDGANVVANLPKELETIAIFLNKPELILPDSSAEDKACFNTAVRNKLSSFLNELKEHLNSEVSDLAQNQFRN
ncbi:hypothetical protein ACD661_06825 [Legionella lytica]|uniref:Uncharacterized protein n=1 Tax=Legionella lytica TaxID=96232 RepID=A0ABW8D6E1_9GAMM